MTTHIFHGTSIAVRKRLQAAPGSPTADLSDKEVKIGLGATLLTLTGWTPASVVQAWNNSENETLREITASLPESGGTANAVIFTHNTAGQDFELTILVDNTLVNFVSELQELRFLNNVTGGTFTLTWDGQTTGNITYVAGDGETTASNILAALENLSNVQIGDLTVTAESNTVFVLDWGFGQYQSIDVPLPDVDYTNLTGGGATLTVATVQNGNAGTNEIQSISMPGYAIETRSRNEIQEVYLTGASSGTFTLTLDGYGTTGAIAYNATRVQVQAALEAALGAGSVQVSGGPLPNSVVRITFVGPLAGIDLPLMTGEATELVSEGLDVTISEFTAGAAGNNLIKRFSLPATVDAANLDLYEAYFVDNTNTNNRLRTAAISLDSTEAQILAALLGDWDFVSTDPSMDLSYGVGPGPIVNVDAIEVLGNFEADGHIDVTLKGWMHGVSTFLSMYIAPKTKVYELAPANDAYYSTSGGSSTWSPTDATVQLGDETLDRFHLNFPMDIPTLLEDFPISRAALTLTQSSSNAANETRIALSMERENALDPTFPSDAADARSRTLGGISGGGTILTPGQDNSVTYPALSSSTINLTGSTNAAGWLPGNNINLVLSAQLVNLGPGVPVPVGGTISFHSVNAATAGFRPKLTVTLGEVLVSGTTQQAATTGTNEVQNVVVNTPLPTEGNMYVSVPWDGDDIVTGPISLEGLGGNMEILAGRMQTALNVALRLPAATPPDAVTFQSYYRDSGGNSVPYKQAVVAYPITEQGLRSTFDNASLNTIVPSSDSPHLSLSWVGIPQKSATGVPTYSGVSDVSSPITTYAGLAAKLNAMLDAAYFPVHLGGWPFGGLAAVANTTPVSVAYFEENTGAINDAHFRIAFNYWPYSRSDIALMSWGLSPTGTDDPQVIITLVQDGGEYEEATITGGTFGLVIQSEVGDTEPVFVYGIPWNTSAATLETILNSVLGADSVECTGGPFPDEDITVTFSGGSYQFTPLALMQVILSLEGDFGGGITHTVLQEARTPTDYNVWDFELTPGYGTLAVDITGDNSWISIQFHTPQGIVERLQFQWAYMTPMRLQLSINEAFGKDVCRVVQAVHSMEWREVNVNYGTVDAVTRKVWYYRDVFRVIFCNDYADPATITDVTITFPQVASGETSRDADSRDWMIYPEGSSGGSQINFDDWQNESSRTYLAFVAAKAAGNPIEKFEWSRGDDPDDTTVYRFKFLSKYHRGMLTHPPSGSIESVNTVTPRASNMTLDYADARIRFAWHRIDASFVHAEYGILSANHEQGWDMTGVLTPLLEWDSPAEAIQYALENLADLNGTPIFGVGNVQVTGSLVSSWLPEDTLAPLPSESYNDLRVTLTGRLARLPFWDGQWRLSMAIIQQGNIETSPWVGVPLAWGDLMSTPVPPLRNERQRIVVPEPSFPAQLQLGYSGQLITVGLTETAQSVEDKLNALSSLGKFTSNTVEGTTTGTMLMPARWSKSVTVIGRNLLSGLEFEFAGYGLQYSDVGLLQLGLLPTEAGDVIVVTPVQDGIIQQQEIQTLTLAGLPWTGQFRLVHSGNQTALLDRDATAAEVQAALVALGSLGADSVLATGGPLMTDDPEAEFGPITMTFAQSLNNVDQLTIADNTLKNVLVETEETSKGGKGGSLIVTELTRGNGPNYWDCPDNWSNGVVPSSDDTAIVDDSRAAIRFGIRQRTRFVIDTSGTAARFAYAWNRRTFLTGQKVYVRAVSGVLPGGLDEGYYFVRNSLADHTFQLSETIDGTLVGITDPGEPGLWIAEVRGLTLQVYARYAGRQVGLPKRRSGQSGILEYLAQYLEMGFESIEVGIDEGEGLTLGKFDTIDLATDVVIRRSATGPDTSIPAVLLLSDSEDTTLTIDDGQVGVAVYADESAVLKNLLAKSGEIVIGNLAIDSGVDRFYRVMPGVTARSLNFTVDGVLITLGN